MQHRGLLGAILALSLLVIGATAGGMVAGLLVKEGTGFDGLGDVLTGLFLGGAAGLVAAILMANALAITTLRRLVIVAVVVATALLLVGTLSMRREMDRANREAAQPTTLQPITEAPTPPDD